MALDKEDKWVQTFRRRQDEFHVPLQEDGWERLADALAIRPSSRRWRYGWIAASAVAAVLLFLLLLTNAPEKQPLNEPPAIIRRETTPTTAATTVIAPSQPSAAVAIAALRPPASPIPSAAQPCTEVNEQLLTTAMDPIDAVETTDAPKEEKAPTPQPFIGPEQEAGQKVVHIAGLSEKKPSKQKWSIGLSTGTHNSNTTTSMNHVLYESNTINAPVYSYEQYHHRFPLTTEVSVRKSIAKSFALESGLRYTYLHSDISRTGVAGYVGSQKLHYIGVPLRADWLFYNRGRISAYLAAGMLLEYALSAQREWSDKTVPLDINRFQASVTAAAGMQVTLFSSISFFIEPGIGHYFNKDNEIETFRTEKPWMLNLQAGIRFSY
jgi:hypothetical protein